MRRKVRGQAKPMTKEERAARTAKKLNKPSARNRVGRLWARKHLEGR